MPWKQDYTVSDEKTLPDVAWPGAAACAVMLVVDPSPPCASGGLGEAEWHSDEAHYGLEVALPRLLDLFEAHRVRATFPVPAALAERHPALVNNLAARGHEVAAHGWRREDVSALQRHEEAWRVMRATEVLSAVLGHAPRGWYSLPRQSDRFPGGAVTRNTIDLLIDAGYEYFGNSQADDIPHYWVTDVDKQRSLLAMPYSYHYDDQFFVEFPAVGKGGSNLERPQTLLRNWIAEFDAMAGTDGSRGFGRSITCVVHGWLNGWGQRLAVLDEFLAHVRRGVPVWIPTAGECASYWKKAYPPETALRLEPSIWVQHPGSLG